jgi:hypothetical protein
LLQNLEKNKGATKKIQKYAAKNLEKIGATKILEKK